MISPDKVRKELSKPFYNLRSIAKAAGVGYSMLYLFVRSNSNPKIENYMALIEYLKSAGIIKDN